MVERSNLAALEFLMSKQPRGNVRVGMGNAAGARVSNIFADVKKFQIRYQEAREKASSQYSKVCSTYKHWQYFFKEVTLLTEQSHLSLVLFPEISEFVFVLHNQP